MCYLETWVVIGFSGNPEKDRLRERDEWTRYKTPSIAYHNSDGKSIFLRSREVQLPRFICNAYINDIKKPGKDATFFNLVHARRELSHPSTKDASVREEGERAEQAAKKLPQPITEEPEDYLYLCTSNKRETQRLGHLFKRLYITVSGTPQERHRRAYAPEFLIDKLQRRQMTTARTTPGEPEARQLRRLHSILKTIPRMTSRMTRCNGYSGIQFVGPGFQVLGDKLQKLFMSDVTLPYYFLSWTKLNEKIEPGLSNDRTVAGFSGGGTLSDVHPSWRGVYILSARSRGVNTGTSIVVGEVQQSLSVRNRMRHRDGDRESPEFKTRKLYKDAWAVAVLGKIDRGQLQVDTVLSRAERAAGSWWNADAFSCEFLIPDTRNDKTAVYDLY
ncbi:hypothetical protein FISHEDRAFT_55136 [Fistulina hepatica ATCC 64428]|uniref:Uncharacterized protein n=1 Tax=Fistulina hepatica ATCC 64428 TaxID=1128425 RepID=A0A0D7API5_9AGAR|nr:hypothetical protein FISHEDRAFT_55136 [Fistulina hepatica ATCC 64428]